MSKPSHPKPLYCPECGYQAVDGRFFACDSYWLYMSGHVKQSSRCEARQLEQQLEKMRDENARLRKLCEPITDPRNDEESTDAG